MVKQKWYLAPGGFRKIATNAYTALKSGRNLFRYKNDCLQALPRKKRQTALVSGFSRPPEGRQKKANHDCHLHIFGAHRETPKEETTPEQETTNEDCTYT